MRLNISLPQEYYPSKNNSPSKCIEDNVGPLKMSIRGIILMEFIAETQKGITYNSENIMSSMKSETSMKGIIKHKAQNAEYNNMCYFPGNGIEKSKREVVQILMCCLC
jgi:hypothetical protein